MEFFRYFFLPKISEFSKSFESSNAESTVSFESMKFSIEENGKELLNCENYIYLAKKFHAIFSLNDPVSNFIFNFSKNQMKEKFFYIFILFQWLN